MAETALIPYDPTKFPLIADHELGVQQIADIQSLGLTRWNLDRLKVPSGESAPVWAVRTSAGEGAAQEILCVMLHSQTKLRAWYRRSMALGGKAPPDCASKDGINGFGRVSIPKDGEPDVELPAAHLCPQCPWYQWESARDPGKIGSDCRMFAHVFVMREGAFMPTLLQVSVTGLKPLRQYVVDLMNEGRKPFGVITRLTLERAVSKTGIKYLQIGFTRAGDLSKEATIATRDLAEKMKAYAQDLPVEVDEEELAGTVQ